MLNRGGDDVLRGTHNAQIYHVIVIALKYNAHDVFPDIMDISLHCRHQNPRLPQFRAFAGFHLEERLEIVYGLFHDSSTFDHLW